MARAVWLYYMCKLIELLDTVSMNNNNRIITKITGCLLSCLDTEFYFVNKKKLKYLK